MPIELTYAGLLYWDRTLLLATGEVVPKGIDLIYERVDDPGELFRIQCQEARYPVSEMSASSYVAMLSRGDDRFTAIPVFPSRHFRHAQVYVNTACGVRTPQDLRGARVGILEYQMTAALWIRAFLEHDYGVRPAEIRWFTGGLREPGFQERFAFDLPTDVSLELIPSASTLEGMLETGDLDALVSAYPPIALGSPESPVSRLFPDYPRVERAYFTRTGIFPIMHIVVLNRTIYEEDPWVASALYAAFETAKRHGRERLYQITGLAVSLPWLEEYLDENDRLFGGDPFPLGVTANERTLNAFLDYAFEQGISTRRLKLPELFTAETLST